MAETPMTNAPAAEVQPTTPSDTQYAPASTMESVAQPNLTQANQPAYGEPGAPAQPSTVVPAGAPAAQPAAPPKHAHLLAMVQGLADGLSAAATSIATHGREGGAPQVQEQRLQRQQAQQSADKAAQEKAAAAQDFAIKTQTLNMMNSNNKIALATFSDKVAQSHLEVTGEQQKQAVTNADFQAAHGGMLPEEFSKQMANTTPLNEQGNAVNPFFLNQGQSVLRAAQTAKIPATNPAVQRLTEVLANPKATARDIYSATTLMQAEQDRQSKAQDQAVKEQTGAQGAIKTAQEQLAQDTFNRTVPKNAQGQPNEDFAT
jgi:hypothetical protein